MSAEPSSTPIEYAPPDRVRRRLVRRLSIAGTLLLLLISAYWWLPLFWHRVEVAYWYDRCLAYHPPLGRVVQHLRGGGPDLPSSTSGGGGGYVPTEWLKLYSMLSPPGFQSGGTVFLGERQMPNGTRVLLAVDFVPGSPWMSASQREYLTLHVRTFVTDAGGLSLPRQTIDSVAVVPIEDVALRLLVGMPDPKDPTHFTISYDLEPARGRRTIDGWVRDDGVDFDNPSGTAATRTSRRFLVSPG
jgi:hypothetical protein